MAVSNDGSTLVVSQSNIASGLSYGINLYRVADGAHLRCIGGRDERLTDTRQIWIAPDDFVYVAQGFHCTVVVFTPQFTFHGFVGEGVLLHSCGVSGNSEIIAVSEFNAGRISVFSRRDGVFLHRFGSRGRGDGQLYDPGDLCFLAGGCIAVVDCTGHRISVFSDGGDFIRVMGVGKLKYAFGIASSTSGDEVVVADRGNFRIVVLSASGEMLRAIETSEQRRSRVAVHGGTIFVQNLFNKMCDVYA